MVLKAHLIPREAGINQFSAFRDVQLLGADLRPSTRGNHEHNQNMPKLPMGGSATYHRIPYVNWDSICQPKARGGLGIKHLALWNNASIGKLVWAVALEKQNLWVRWVHGRYLKGQSWWAYKLKGDTSWY